MNDFIFFILTLNFYCNSLSAGKSMIYLLNFTDVKLIAWNRVLAHLKVSLFSIVFTQIIWNISCISIDIWWSLSNNLSFSSLDCNWTWLDNIVDLKLIVWKKRFRNRSTNCTPIICYHALCDISHQPKNFILKLVWVWVSNKKNFM